MTTQPDAPILVGRADFDAAVFDLDGVITQTADVHATAWRQLFDEFLQRRAAAEGTAFEPFDIARDYRLYVDGRPRSDGVRSFLESRGICLKEGSADASADRDTIAGLAARKDRLFLKSLAAGGVRVFGDALSCVRRLREIGMRTAIVSSSRNASAVLTTTGLSPLFDVLVDGVEAQRQGLKGKPAPDTFLHAARKLGVAPPRLVGFEDALVGVEALHAAGYGLVIGVDRHGQPAEFRDHGADATVADLGRILVRHAARPRTRERPQEAPQVVPTDDDTWRLVEDGFTIAREHELESILAIGNGRLGSRASLAEGSALSAPATFVAGLFDDQPGLTPRLASLPDWANLSLTIEGVALRLDSGRILEHRRIADFKQGLLWREWRHADAAGRITSLRGFRLASIADRRLLLQSVTLTPENYSGGLRVDRNMGDLAVLRTSRGVTAALATETYVGGGEAAAPTQEIEAPAVQEVELGGSYRLDRVAAVVTSREVGDPESAAEASARAAAATGLSELVERHIKAWEERWTASDMRLEGDHAAQRALRFAAYHLISAANPEDSAVSIGARALTGAAYNGHVFWDTEIFMLPFFVLTWPEAARSLLLYRHRTLPEARAKAQRFGARGAFYAWESADTGEDVTPSVVVAPDGVLTPIHLAAQEQHISADIAYAVWSYWRATRDENFLLEAGAEIIFETARFWATRAERGADGLRHIRKVVGPDEYHEAVDDDAYTNGMAQWNLETAVTLWELLGGGWPHERSLLAAKLRLAEAEVGDWATIADQMYTGLDPKTGLIEQFSGYFQLEDIDLSALGKRSGPIDVLLGRERIQRSQVIKQPDVIMLLHLLWDRFPPEVRHANFRYYDRRCAHGSSLSPAIHSLVAARLGDIPLAERYFRQAMEIDLANNMGNCAGGVHAAALGGLWQAAAFGFAGLRLEEGGPELRPNLPASWKQLSFRILWRGRQHELVAVPRTFARSQQETLP